METPESPSRYPLEQIRRVLEGLPHFQELGLTLTKLVPGSCTIHLAYDPRLVGNAETGTVHGGVITTLLDSVAGAAAFTVVDQGQSAATLDLRIDYLRPAAEGRDLLGRADVLRRTRTVVFVRAVAYHETADDPIALATACFMVGSVGFTVGG